MPKPLTKRQKEKLARDSYALAVETAGGFAALARLCGVSREAARRWQVLPAQHVIHIAERFRMRRGDLAPDIYPDDPPTPITRTINGKETKTGASQDG